MGLARTNQVKPRLVRVSISISCHLPYAIMCSHLAVVCGKMMALVNQYRKVVQYEGCVQMIGSI